MQGELQKLVLRRCLLLVLLLDTAAQRPDTLHDATPLLFRLSSRIKSSAEVPRPSDTIKFHCRCICAPLRYLRSNAGVRLK